MRSNNSVKHRRIGSTIDEDQDLFDNLIRVSRTNYIPGPTGSRVHMSQSLIKIVRGGLGSGKSRCALEEVNNLALKYPGTTHAICRKDLTSLKETTQKEFLEQVVDSATIDQFNVNDNKLYYKNGSEVLFRETKDPDKFKSMTLTSFLVDEADENETDESYKKLRQRLRQRIFVNGMEVALPRQGLLVFNPTDDKHWLYHLAKRHNIDQGDVEDFRFDTYENAANLPADYIPQLIADLPPWEIDRLVHGHWGRTIKGKPVIHGFSREKHVRPLKVNGWLPIFRGWDFGFNHPANLWMQIDPIVKRVYVLREYMGDRIKLQDGINGEKGVVSIVKELTRGLVGEGHPLFDFGDPRGADEKDVGLSSIEYLRLHHGIHILANRERIRTGLDELQHKVITMDRLDPEDPKSEHVPLLLVDPSCEVFIRALEGGYERDEQGLPIKDGFFDHLVDVARYLITNNMNPVARQAAKKRQYKPGNVFTGY